MSLLPVSFEFLQLFTKNFLPIVILEVFSELGNCFKLHKNFLEVAATLSSGAALQILLKSFEDFTDPN
jgi:hypothetical protein